MNDVLEITSNSESETEALGKSLMKLLPEGVVVALRGDLGAGKTCFVRGMAAAIDSTAVSSPTFTMVHEYAGARTIYHVDLYRIGAPAEVLDLGYEDLFEPGDGVSIIEWAERAESMLPTTRIDITLQHADEHVRKIRVTNAGVLTGDWQERLREAQG